MRNARLSGVLLFSGLAMAVLIPATLIPVTRAARGRTEIAALPGTPRTLVDAGRMPAHDLEEIRESMREGKPLEEGHAWEAFNWWYGTRAYPNELLPKEGFFQAWQAAQALRPPVQPRSAVWQSIGPDNVGGRVLALAIDPTNPNFLWAGTASGGLWLSTTAGEGADAWTRVETGFPALSVSAVVIQPDNANVMYLGTGEMSLYQRGLVGTPGARSTYGLGVLKSTDHGNSWAPTGLNWTFDQRRAVIAMKMDPHRPEIVWAATSEGLYKTTNAGTIWELKHDVLMAMDVVMDARDGDKVWVSHGQLNSVPNPGLYRSLDGGNSWVQLTTGLPSTDFGRCPLSIYSPGGGGPGNPDTDPNILYAGCSNASTRQVVGLYKSTNDGTSWTRVNSTNWASSQAWYNNAVSVSPFSVSTVLCGGLDAYRSTNGGATLSQVSVWFAGFEGQIPPGGPEGPANYVHADHHVILWHPTIPSTVYIGCDGGVFKSTDSGVNWAGKNGGFETTQFYAGFASGAATGPLALGGLQDNGTVRYNGSPSWSKVFGGDGGYCAIDPSNEQIMYEEYVNLNIHKSVDGGESWFEIYNGGSEANFIAPFTLCESSPQVLYAGTRGLLKSTNGGSNWFYPDGNSNWNGTPMASIAVAFDNTQNVVAATGSGAATAVFEVRSSTNGGQTWTNVTAQLPSRFVADISFDQTDHQRVWMAVSGFGSGHVWKSLDAGLTWTDASGDLPDIPAQAIAADPIDPNWVYVGTDLGTFRSTDGGASWTDFNLGMPVTMVLDLQIKRDSRVMRAATFGNGIYEIDLPTTTTGVAALPPGAVQDLAAGPNPFSSSTTLRFTTTQPGEVRIRVLDVSGRLVRNLLATRLEPGAHEATWDAAGASGERVQNGIYFLQVLSAGHSEVVKVTVRR